VATPDPSAQPDFVVIGGGPAGYGAALTAANAGASVVLVDAGGLGGTCLQRGCIPAKYFLEAASVFRSVSHAATFGITTSAPGIDFSVTQQNKATLVGSIATGLAKLLKLRGVRVLTGRGTLHADRTVTVDVDGAVTTFAPRFVILATGSRPRAIDVLPVDGAAVMDSDGFLNLERLPSSAIVVGGGAIGCEFASMLSDLGVSVHLVEGLDRILAGCDGDVSKVVHRSFTKRGIAVTTGVQVLGRTLSPDGATVELSSGATITADLVVVAVGREPVTTALAEGLELDHAGSGALIATEQQMTSMPGVYAVGDLVAGRPQLAHVGFAEAQIAVGHALGSPLPPLDVDGVPWAIYCRPEVAFVGLTEEEATRRGLSIVTKREPIGGNSRAQIIGETEGLVKVICAAEPDGTAGAILGVHLVGPWATEQLGHGELAVNLGLDVEAVARFIQPHPSLTEQYGETLLALSGRGMHVR